MKLFRFLFWFMVLIVAALLSAVGFLFTMVTPAYASEWSERTCALVARDAGVLHDFKTGGMTWEEAEPQLKVALDNALAGENSYVKDAVDVERSLEVARFVWKHDMSRDVAVEVVEAACIVKWSGVEI